MRPALTLLTLLSFFSIGLLFTGTVAGDTNGQGEMKIAKAADIVKPDIKKAAEKKETKKNDTVSEKDETAGNKKEQDATESDPNEKDDKNKSEECDEKKKSSNEKDADKKKGPKKCEKPTFELKKEPFVIKVSLKGTFEAQKMTEVSIWPESWSSFTVLKAVKHGTRVKQGDLLVSLDPEKIDRATDDLRAELRLAELDLKKAEMELQTVETVSPLELAALEREKRIFDEDYDYFLKHEYPFTKKAIKFYLKANKDQLEYQKEELRQLEKMYKADDITEETEEIVLRRTRDSVEQGEFGLESAKTLCARLLDYALPRQKESFKDAHKRQELTYEAQKALFPLDLEKKRIEFERMKVQHQRAKKNLKEILADRKFMTIKSPADGIVYYGRCVDGEWAGGNSEGEFERDSSLPVKQAFMTIVKTRPMRIAAQVPEKELHNVRGGLKGRAVPTGYPDVKLDVIVDEVATIPNGSNFDAKITVALDKQAKPLMPGMTCDVKLVAYEKRAALAVPLASVKADPLDEDKFFVHRGRFRRQEQAP